jgi:HK97 family phage portal protein
MDELTDQTTWVVAQSYGSGDTEPLLPTYLSYSQLGYCADAVVFGCVLQRLQMFTEARFKWRNLRDRTMYGTEALSLLERPWPGGSTPELLARMEQDASLAGNAFIRRIDPSSGGEPRLERLRPDLVTIISEKETDVLDRHYRTVVGYAYNPSFDPSRRVEIYDVSEVAHWSPIPDPLAQWRGMSWLTPVVREIDADVAMSRYKLKHLDNAATPNLLLKYARKMNPEDVDRVKARFAAKYGGPDNAGRALILDDGADATVIGSTFSDMEFDKVQSAGAQRIGFAAGLPTELLPGSAESRTPQDTAYAQAMRRFADTTMRPNWRGACASLAKLVDVPGGAELWFDTSDIRALQPGEKDAADVMALQATTTNTLIMAGFKPDSVITAVTAGDLNLLEHSGLVSVQMQDIHGDQQPAEQPAEQPIPGGT